MSANETSTAFTFLPFMSFCQRKKFLFPTLVSLFLLTEMLWGNSSGPPDAQWGQNCTSCHDTSAVNSVTFDQYPRLPSFYNLGETYNLTALVLGTQEEVMAFNLLQKKVLLRVACLLLSSGMAISNEYAEHYSLSSGIRISNGRLRRPMMATLPFMLLDWLRVVEQGLLVTKFTHSIKRFYHLLSSNGMRQLVAWFSLQCPRSEWYCVCRIKWQQTLRLQFWWHSQMGFHNWKLGRLESDNWSGRHHLCRILG